MTEMTERTIPSSDGIHQLYGRVFVPDGEIKGLLHVVHGMTEHIHRYEDFMRAAAEQGYVCFGFDNLGHGRTARDESELGYIGTWRNMTDDVRRVSLLMKAEFGADLPCFLMGHSMGSFIARCAATPRIWQKAVIMGTGGPNPAARSGLALLRRMIKREGERAVSPAIEKLLFGAYNKRFADEKDRLAWLSTVREERDAYRTDPYCTFHFTLNGFYVLIRLTVLCNSRAWFHGVSAELPMLLVSGGDDPVGGYGKGVGEVYRLLRQNGKNVQMKVYEGCRHEILNDTCREEVRKDIFTFLQT